MEMDLYLQDFASAGIGPPTLPGKLEPRFSPPIPAVENKTWLPAVHDSFHHLARLPVVFLVFLNLRSKTRSANQ